MLIHSPLVGPATLAPLAASLEELGWTARLPDLRAGVASPSRFASIAAGQPGADVVVGHSGAGPFLPTVATAVGATATVFVDAIVPPAEDVYTPTAGLSRSTRCRWSTGHCRRGTSGGRRRCWRSWSPTRRTRGPGRRDATRPASVLRRGRAAPGAVVDEARRVLQLTAGYADDRARAATWGWPTDRLDGTHLDTATRPDIVAARLIDLTSRIHRTG